MTVTHRCAANIPAELGAASTPQPLRHETAEGTVGGKQLLQPQVNNILTALLGRGNHWGMGQTGFPCGQG